MQQDPKEENVRLEKLLSSVDSIMELNILSIIPKFLKTGGTPQQIVQLLSESYRGRAQMCNMIGDWLVKLSGDQEAGKEAVHQMIEGHLKSLLLERFDPKKADSIFSEKESSQPEWLEKMIQQPRYRSMIYELSEIHKNCVLLNFAIQAISEAGHQAEITGIATASKYVDVFSKVLVDSMTQLKKETDEAILLEKIPEFTKMCSQSQHTYLYAQTLIHRLMQEPNGYIFKRLSQELDLAVRHHGKAAMIINLLLSGLSESNKVAEAISSIIRSKSSTPGDVLILHQEYSGPNPPLIDFLQNPELLEILLNDIFGPVKGVNPLHKNKYFFLLASAVCIEPGIHEPINLEKIQPTIAALETAEHIARTNPFGSELEASLPKINSCLEFPIAAKALLFWIRTCLDEKDYYLNNFSKSSSPIHLILLEEVAIQHRLLRESVFQILCEEFERGYSEQNSLIGSELRRHILERMIFLFHIGYVFPIVKYMERKGEEFDQALVTHFILSVIELIEGPYANEFLIHFLNIMKSPSTKAALQTNNQLKPILFSFFESCLTPEASDAVRESISELQKFLFK